MTKAYSSPKRNVERIRQQNLEDNQLFLKKLLMANIHNDFVNSARSIIRKDGNNPAKKYYHQYEKVEHATRYNEKLKSGEISPHVPEWQRLVEEKKKEAEKRLLEKEERRLKMEQKKQEYEQRKQELLLEKEQKRLKMEQKKQEYEQRKQELLLERELRKIERELKMEEQIRIRLAKQRPPKPSPWAIFNKNNPRPYERSFKPRSTKVGERAEQNLFNLNTLSQ